VSALEYSVWMESTTATRGFVASSAAWIFSSSISGSRLTFAAFTPRRRARSATCCADSSPVM
jgi:hypothetical protein